MCIDKKATKKTQFFKLFLLALTNRDTTSSLVVFSCLKFIPLVIIPLKPKPFGGKNMKALFTIAFTIVLTAALLTGCGCTNRNIEKTPEPTVLPTNEEIWNSTETTVNPTVSTATDPTRNTTNETLDTIPGTTGDTRSTLDTNPTDDTMASRARRMMPDMR